MAMVLRVSGLRWVLAALLCGIATAQTSHRSWTTENGLPQNSVQSILETHDGFLWIGTEKGLARFDGFDFVNYSRENSPELTNDDVRALTEDRSDTLLLATAQGSFRLEHGHFLSAAQLAEPLSKEIRDRRGMTWSYDGDEVIRHNVDGRLARWKVVGAGSSNRIQALLLDTHSILWIGTRRGLFRMDRDRLLPVAELSNDSVLCLLEDREGNIWAGASGTGLHLFSPRSVEVVPAFANRGITTVAASPDGDLWVGTPEDGLLRLHQNQVGSVTSEQGLSSNFVLSLAVAGDSNVLVGSPDGFNRLTGMRISSTLRAEDGLPDDFVRSILPNPDGSVWIGTRRGLARWDRGQISVIDHASGLPSDLVGSLLRASNGDLWIGTLHGVSRLHEGQITSFMQEDAATSLVEDAGGRVWLGTASSGLYLWEGSNFHRVQATSAPQKIFGLLYDGRESLWLRTHSGLARVGSDQAAACALRQACDLTVRMFNTGDGLPSNDIFDAGHPGQVRGKDGMLYFATRRGLAKINPASIQSNPAVPLPTITHLTIDNVDRPIQSGQAVTLEPSDRRVTFSYIAPSFRQPAKVHYRYRLDGFDRDWVDAGSIRSVSYTNLPSGSHRFLVMAANEDGVWSQSPAELVIVVHPPIYRRWWFYLLTALAAATVFLLFYWLRERKLKQQFAAVLSERSRIAREIHDTLAQDLAGVSVQLEVVSSLMKNHQPEAAAARLEETKSVVREGLTNARRSIWDLRASADEQTLPVRVKDALAQVAGTSEAVHLEITGPYRPLAPRIEEELLSILKEAVRNAVQHAESALVDVTLNYRPDALVLIVRDEGRGFDAAGSPAAGHFGLQGMRERAEAIGATLTIESEQEKGTWVTLVVASK